MLVSEAFYQLCHLLSPLSLTDTWYLCWHLSSEPRHPFPTNLWVFLHLLCLGHLVYLMGNPQVLASLFLRPHFQKWEKTVGICHCSQDVQSKANQSLPSWAGTWMTSWFCLLWALFGVDWDFCFVLFQAEFHATQPGLELTLLLRMTLNFWSSRVLELYQACLWDVGYST